MRHALAILLPLLAVLIVACSGEPEPGDEPASPAAAAAPAPGDASGAAAPAKSAHEELVERGQRVYMANCIACHNPDPTQAGGIGPDVAGSSKELIEARVLRAEYPPGYKPKRDTHAMIALPFLKDDIDALAAFLGQAGGAGAQ
jgi:mono/diheme cytochrome c family protein